MYIYIYICMYINITYIYVCIGIQNYQNQYVFPPPSYHHSGFVATNALGHSIAVAALILSCFCEI